MLLPLSPSDWRSFRHAGVPPRVEADPIFVKCISLHPLDKIFSFQSFMELHRPVVVQRYYHLPIVPYELAMGPKFEKNLVLVGSRHCETHIFETVRLIFPVLSYMEFTRLVVGHCHLRHMGSLVGWKMGQIMDRCWTHIFETTAPVSSKLGEYELLSVYLCTVIIWATWAQ